MLLLLATIASPVTTSLCTESGAYCVRPLTGNLCTDSPGFCDIIDKTNLNTRLRMHMWGPIAFLLLFCFGYGYMGTMSLLQTSGARRLTSFWRPAAKTS